ncbi:right-handed parallel beta-helix repeat-containing protein [Halomicrococcus gelatinilyticus]|uniref:right-handed parallel beta-helix repeat-containing protein n=1 Tax=Halomicrococcus gelatinilyticus TaxID=1702103 RepID=UPI002E1422EF
MVELSRRRILAGALGLALGVARRPGGGNDPGARGAVADRVVSSTAELEAAFDALSPGETVAISAANAPYRTTRWLDVDADGVTVVGPGVASLVKPADGANVGGIRIGHHDHCENVAIRGVGFHGNPEGQRRSAKRCHGILVRDAADVSLSGNLVTRTHPYHEHGSGGSGVSADRESRDVRVVGNRVWDAGDRGIQVASERALVAGNVVTDGFDRSISCDVWRDGSHQQARNVAVVGNVLGDNVEGSLTGVGGTAVQADRGYVLVANNVGFGRHKSFFHVGFDGSVRNVRVEGNVSVQDGVLDNAGVSVNADRVTNVSVVDNDLSGYGGRGVNVERGVSGFTVAGNRIDRPDSVGVRVAGATDGTVENNVVERAGRAGIELDDARFVVVRGNRVRDVARAGVVATASGRTPSNHEISDNEIRGYGTANGAPGVLVRTAGNVVRGNRIFQRGGPAILEGPGGERNRYGSNWARGRSPWRIDHPGSVVTDHVPPFDVHRGLVADASGTAAVRFDKPYARPPRLSFGRVGGGVRDVTYTTSGDAFDGAVVTVGSPGAAVDVFVDPF